MPLEGDPFAIMKVLRAGSQVHRDNREAERHLKVKIKEKLSKGGTGRTYDENFFTDEKGIVHPIGVRRPHTASRPGRPPARDSGALLKGMNTWSTRTAYGADLFFASTAGYSSFLEFGTSRMAPRPYMRPLARENAVPIRRIYAAGIEARERAMARALGGEG